MLDLNDYSQVGMENRRLELYRRKQSGEAFTIRGVAKELNVSPSSISVWLRQQENWLNSHPWWREQLSLSKKSEVL